MKQDSNRNNRDVMKLQTSSTGSLKKGSMQDKCREFLKKFNPDYQTEISKDIRNCYFGKFPTLANLSYYGGNAAKAWVILQLNNLSEQSGCKDKMTLTQLNGCADVIITEFSYLKISEVMLFMHRFKAGKYQRFYGFVDPIVITSSLQTFAKERLQYINSERERQTDAYDQMILRMVKESNRKKREKVLQDLQSNLSL